MLREKKMSVELVINCNGIVKKKKEGEAEQAEKELFSPKDHLQTGSPTTQTRGVTLN